MSHKTEYIWTCKIGGPAIQFQSGADAPMRQAVQAAFKQVTGNDEVFCFSGWGGELTEPERAVVENRLPSDEHEAEWNRRAAAQAAQPEAVGERWPNVEAAMQDPLFQRARAIMGTENWFQDNALRNVVNYVLAATGDALRAENTKLREDIAEMVRADSDNALAALAAAPTEAKPAQDAVDAVIPLDKDELAQLIAEHLGCTYHCTRVWEAWNVGTMSRKDFEPVDESGTPTEIADAIIDAIRAAISAKKVHP